MGRIRSKYAKGDIDKKAFECLERAESALHQAVGVYEAELRKLPSDEKRKIHDRLHLVHSAIATLASVKPLQSRIDLEDKDLKPSRGRR